jgi:fatty-acyl-CoA synthase
VAAVLLNDHRTLEVAWGLQRSGLYMTFVNTHLSPEETAYIVNDCEARVLITSSALNGLSEALVPLTPGIGLRLAIGSPVPSGSESYEAFVRDQPPTPLADEQEGSAMLYSSGTTGRPKGIRRPLSGLPFGRGQSILVPILGGIMGFEEGDVYLNPAPLYHAAPLIWTMSAQGMGGTVVSMDRFDPEVCLDLIATHRVTHAQFVPTMFVRMLKLPDEVRRAKDISSLRSVVHAAAPCAPEVKRRMIEWFGPIIHEFYAGSEGGGMTWITSEQWMAHPGSVGPSLWGTVYICDDDGNVLAVGEDGVVWFGGVDNNFEYKNDPEKTKQTINDRGWSTLWDVGHLDADNYLYLTDRKLFMIVSGGVNIYPQEVEDVLVLHPAVADVAVFGVPNSEMGEEVKAVIQPAPGADPGPELAEEILAFCRDHLSHYKCPRSVDFTDALPRGENGKLYKKKLRDTYWADSNSIMPG